MTVQILLMNTDHIKPPLHVKAQQDQLIMMILLVVLPVCHTVMVSVLAVAMLRSISDQPSQPYRLETSL